MASSQKLSKINPSSSIPPIHSKNIKKAPQIGAFLISIKLTIVTIKIKQQWIC